MTADLKQALSTRIAEIETRVTNLEQKKEKTLAKWWDKLIDKLIWIVIIAALVVLLKWLGAPPEIVNQLPH
jgi:magnesium-transporting ATPase (P-type)